MKRTLPRGQVAVHPEILVVRPMTRDDLALIAQKRPYAQGKVAKFRDSHHRVARLFASGLRPSEVAERSGYSMGRIVTLNQDPAFQELISKYRAKVDDAWVESVDEFYQEGTEIMRIVQRQVRDRLEEADDDEATPIPLNQLIALGADHMDRFGYGKRQTNLNVNADFAALLEKAIARSGKTIEATVTQPVRSSQSQPEAEPLQLSAEPTIPTEQEEAYESQPTRFSRRA